MSPVFSFLWSAMSLLRLAFLLSTLSFNACFGLFSMAATSSESEDINFRFFLEGWLLLDLVRYLRPKSIPGLVRWFLFWESL